MPRRRPPLSALVALLLALLPGAALAQPANDALAGATAIAGTLPQVLSGTNVEATAETDEADASCAFSAASVWWSYTPGVNGTVVFSTGGSDFDTVLSLWTGAGHPLAEVACNDDSGFEPTSALTATLTAGTTYFVRVTGYGTEQGTIALTVAPPPANDALAGATVVTGPLPQMLAGTNAGADGRDQRSRFLVCALHLQRLVRATRRTPTARSSSRQPIRTSTRC